MMRIPSEKMSRIAPVVVRIGIALVFLWFGTQQLGNTSAWTGLIPSWATSLSGLDAAALVTLNGAFEIIAAAFLITGLFTRAVALLSALHLLSITFTMGYTGIGVRDFGLSMAAISIFLYGADAWCLDTYLNNKKSNAVQQV